MKKAILVLTLALLSACSSLPTQELQRVSEADQKKNTQQIQRPTPKKQPRYITKETYLELQQRLSEENEHDKNR